MYFYNYISFMFQRIIQYIFILLFGSISFLSFLFIGNVYAASSSSFSLSNIVNPSGYSSSGVIPHLMSFILPLVYGVVGIIVFALILYSGFLWMTSNGDKQKIDRAKSVLTGAAIGATIIFLAYVISLVAVHIL